MPHSQSSRRLDHESSFSSSSEQYHSAILFPDDYSDIYDESSSSLPPTATTSTYPFLVSNSQLHPPAPTSSTAASISFSHPQLHYYDSPFDCFSSLVSSLRRKYWRSLKLSVRHFSAPSDHPHMAALDARRKKATTTQQKRGELEGEMKDLLIELSMVEGEIARLEGQISHLQDGLKKEQEITRESKSKQWKQGFLSSPNGYFSVPSDPLPIAAKGTVQERMGFETKALHFISKAIKGDYHLNDFSTNEKIGSLRSFHDKKEDHFLGEAGFSEKIPRKSGLLKPASPVLDPRHPTPKVVDLETNFPSRSIPPPEEESIKKWQPNKLSESIMKCLMFIFVRLTRTSRAMELERSNPILRSSFSFLSSISFRADAANSKSSLILQKETRQQDPYGIFEPEESISRDIGPYRNLLMFTASSLDPKCISNSSSIPLLEKLRTLMNNLQKVDLRFLTYQEKLAFWINMYNACIMHGFLHYGVPSSPEILLRLLNKATLNIGGNMINAQAIEHFILRKPTSSIMRENGEKDEKETIVRNLYGLESFDANVTFALCCGTRSSPAVRIYTAESVVAELEKSKLEYMQASIVVTSTKKVAFPELLLGNMLDFAVDVDSLVKWVCQQLPTSGTLRKSMVDCFRGQPSAKLSNIVEKIPHEFEFQYLLAI
ncbi:uncharacterized protein LOC131148107 [Malania oleifera]|uniref:uncharacterized protein LOC131148107 n=1 Tax=Malania oleifera TaxID=397392 RepID=UPI0025ADB4AE|nr:uncharacterized protein LOC131148107 [Malania oleifera]